MAVKFGGVRAGDVVGVKKDWYKLRSYGKES